MIHQRGLSERISLFDAMPARQAFAMAEIVVVPSRAESMPYIVLEALAAEKPLIATRVGGIPEVMGTESAALAIPGDATDLARLMQEALTVPGWKDRVMPRPETFRSIFSASHMAGDMMQLYRQLLKQQNSKLS
jgi:glycosyltransferase involved in cell wall biosynthesis